MTGRNAASRKCSQRIQRSTTRPAQNVFSELEAATRRVFSRYSVEIAEGGPAETLRQIRLCRSGALPLVVGWVRPGEGRAVLRTLGYSLALSCKQLGRELAIPPAEYARFIEVAREVLGRHGVEVSVVRLEKEAPQPRTTLPYFTTKQH